MEKYKHQQMGRALGEGDDDDGSTVTAAANIALGTWHVKGGASLSASLVNLSASLSASSWAPVRLVGVDTTRGGDVSEGREGSLNYVLQSTAWRAGTGVSALGQTLSELAQEEDADAIVGGAAMATKTEEERMVDERLNRLDSGMTDVLTVAAWVDDPSTCGTAGAALPVLGGVTLAFGVSPRPSRRPPSSPSSENISTSSGAGSSSLSSSSMPAAAEGASVESAIEPWLEDGQSSNKVEVLYYFLTSSSKDVVTSNDGTGAWGWFRVQEHVELEMDGVSDVEIKVERRQGNTTFPLETGEFKFPNRVLGISGKAEVELAGLVSEQFYYLYATTGEDAPLLKRVFRTGVSTTSVSIRAEVFLSGNMRPRPIVHGEDSLSSSNTILAASCLGLDPKDHSAYTVMKCGYYDQDGQWSSEGCRLLAAQATPTCPIGPANSSAAAAGGALPGGTGGKVGGSVSPCSCELRCHCDAIYSNNSSTSRGHNRRLSGKERNTPTDFAVLWERNFVRLGRTFNGANSTNGSESNEFASRKLLIERLIFVFLPLLFVLGLAAIRGVSGAVRRGCCPDAEDAGLRKFGKGGGGAKDGVDAWNTGANTGGEWGGDGDLGADIAREEADNNPLSPRTAAFRAKHNATQSWMEETEQLWPPAITTRSGCCGKMLYGRFLSSRQFINRHGRCLGLPHAIVNQHEILSLLFSSNRCEEEKEYVKCD